MLRNTVLRGVVAGAAGTVALHVATYVDVTVIAYDAFAED